MKNFFDDLTPLKIIKSVAIFVLIVCLSNGVVLAYRHIAYGRFIPTENPCVLFDGKPIRKLGNRGYIVHYKTPYDVIKTGKRGEVLYYNNAKTIVPPECSIDLFDKDEKGNWKLVKNVFPMKKGFRYYRILNNNNILLAGFESGDYDKPEKIKFVIFNPKKGKIERTVFTQSKVKWPDFADVISLRDNSFLYGICDDKCRMYRYDYDKDKTFEIAYPPNYNSKHSDDTTFGDDTVLFVNLSDRYSISAYKFDRKTNTFKEIDNKEALEIPKYVPNTDYHYNDSNIELLSGKKFIFARTINKGINDNINEISYFEIKENKIERKFTKTFEDLHVGLTDSAFLEFGKDKVLIFGGKWGNSVYGNLNKKRKEAFILDLNTLKITRLNNMNYGHKNISAYKIDENTVYIFGEDSNKGELFKKGKLW